MNILVTGAAGFIGSRLTEALIGHGHTVTGIDNLSTGRVENFPPGVSLDIGDIRIKAKIPTEPWDVIYHCAASYKDRDAWEQDSSTNVGGTINVVREAQRSGAKLVYFQTSLCYGPTFGAVKLDSPLNPRGSYAVSKTAGEAYIRDSGVPYVSLRLANIYGPRNLSGPIPTFYQRLTSGQPCTVVDSRRDFVFIDDLVWLAVEAGKTGQGIYHVSSGADYSIMELYQAVSDALGIAKVATMVARGSDDVASLLLDPSETERRFGWLAMTSLSDGIAKAVAWYADHPVTETYTHLAVKTA